jgi:hypothetical protein
MIYIKYINCLQIFSYHATCKPLYPEIPLMWKDPDTFVPIFLPFL